MIINPRAHDDLIQENKGFFWDLSEGTRDISLLVETLPEKLTEQQNISIRNKGEKSDFFLVLAS